MYDAAALWGGPLIVIPWVLFSQLSLNCPAPRVALPLNTVTPEPLGSRSISPLLVVTISLPFRQDVY